MKKKLFSFVIAALMIFMSLPTFVVPAQAATTEDGLVYEIVDGEVTITGYTGSEENLEIPATYYNINFGKVYNFRVSLERQ